MFLPIGVTARWSLGSASSSYDWIDHDFRLAANTLLILFSASLQAITVGLLADLIVRADQTARPRSTPHRRDRSPHATPTGNTYDKYALDEPDRAADDAAAS